ncbi:hypothetical protein HQN84_01375 [Pedobacter steynii]|uniref:hypothetical protein n=1 Tax=Pedobacter steynii TaxID=430522 RepID=UPI0009452D72|nr:hypothetical protein [Pedobacter steynii]NQX37471.1 hypothetical protein [Pedobacter steynii]
MEFISGQTALESAGFETTDDALHVFIDSGISDARSFPVAAGLAGDSGRIRAETKKKINLTLP